MMQYIRLFSHITRGRIVISYEPYTATEDVIVSWTRLIQYSQMATSYDIELLLLFYWELTVWHSLSFQWWQSLAPMLPFHPTHISAVAFEFWLPASACCLFILASLIVWSTFYHQCIPLSASARGLFVGLIVAWSIVPRQCCCISAVIISTIGFGRRSLRWPLWLCLVDCTSPMLLHFSNHSISFAWLLGYHQFTLLFLCKGLFAYISIVDRIGMITKLMQCIILLSFLFRCPSYFMLFLITTHCCAGVFKLIHTSYVFDSVIHLPWDCPRARPVIFASDFIRLGLLYLLLVSVAPRDSNRCHLPLTCFSEAANLAWILLFLTGYGYSWHNCGYSLLLRLQQCYHWSYFDFDSRHLFLSGIVQLYTSQYRECYYLLSYSEGNHLSSNPFMP